MGLGLILSGVPMAARVKANGCGGYRLSGCKVLKKRKMLIFLM
jgi:hypothetical protein